VSETHLKEIIWVHEDALRPDHPVFLDSRDATRAFIFDNASLAQQRYSLKRLQFITETLIEMNVPIYRGDTCACLKALAAEAGAKRIRMADSPDPAVAQCATNLRKTLDVVEIKDDPFLPELDGEFARFFKFWDKVKKPLLT